MPRHAAERLRQLAMKCSRLARENRELRIAEELEGLSVELADEAAKLDQLFEVIEEA